MQPLYNIHSREQLLKFLEEEDFERRTLSFYRYTPIPDPVHFRDDLFIKMNNLGCLGRIYIAMEGINAQMSVPVPMIDKLLNTLEQLPGMSSMPVKWAIEDDSRSFLKLIIKIRPKIVADGIDDASYKVSDVGNHLSPEEFHRHALDSSTLVVDMRNGYEYEIGHFKGALNLETDTFREAMKRVIHELEDQKEKKIILYCTGGIRCEKASSWMKHHGFQDVNQLHGGIIEYAKYVSESRVDSAFTGKNFVFDNRLGESIDGKTISNCHVCAELCDTYTNCSNDHCHVLFIQCKECAKRLEGCCTEHCRLVLNMSAGEKRNYDHDFLANIHEGSFNTVAARKRKFEKKDLCAVQPFT